MAAGSFCRHFYLSQLMLFDREIERQATRHNPLNSARDNELHSSISNAGNIHDVCS
jgi:hypothetical protein